MKIKGCGKQKAALTFYRLPPYRLAKEPESKQRVSRIACGQRGESSIGASGLLLCPDCAVEYALIPMMPEARANPLRSYDV